ncbi:hypothetical protein [Marinitoga aeolica]|uniref:Uncharacterized protein n=1 Tax=Marinitoga aeolica TaxID=2809031 RepID=A0ABY8PPP3_9BACT|nr:hypothetical protein [Marinitoga aeolica]WGS64591.1 hypothetical protein JRV97_09475 [Marinitoga aeolica]
MSLKKYYLIFLIISFSILIYSEKIPVFKEENFIGYINTSLNDSPNKEILNGYWLNLKEINKELDYFVLGTLNSYDLIYKFSKELGSYLLSKGYDFIIFGNLKTLKEDSENFLDYIASSPYIVSQILYTMIRGFESSGIFPIVYLEKDFNKDIKNSLDQKGGKINYLSDFDNQNYMFYDKINKKIYLNSSYLPKLGWEIPQEENIKAIVSQIFENSIIITGWMGNDYKIYYRELPKNSKEKSIIYFSKDVKNKIDDFLNKKITIYSAKKNWDW